MAIKKAGKKKKKKKKKVKKDAATAAASVSPLPAKAMKHWTDEEKLQALVSGQVTLGELEGIKKSETMELVQLGYSYLDQGRLDDAQAIFEGLVALDPNEPYFLMASGSVAQRQIRYEEAEQWFTACLQIDSRNLVARTNRGEVRLHMKKIKNAAKDLITVVSLDPESKQNITKRAQGLLSEIQRALS